MPNMCQLTKTYFPKSKCRCGAYLTVYLTLTLTVVLSLCLTLIEGTRQNGIYLEAECVTDIGLNSVLAEYHRELLAQYDLFAIDSSYGTSLPQVENTKKRLEFYLNRNLSRDDVFLNGLLYRDFLGMRLKSAGIQKARFLTDDGGRVLRLRAAEAALDEYNLSLLKELQGWMEVVESERLLERDIAAEKKKLDKKLDGYGGEKQISENEWITIDVKNPTDSLEKMRKKGILKLVVEDVSQLSDKKLSDKNLIGSRIKAGSCNQGNLSLGADERTQVDDLMERFLFQEYLFMHMGRYGEEREEHSLAYQMEYLLGGKASDVENLTLVVKCIFAMREAANTIYLYSDNTKKQAAHTLAAVLASAMLVPEATDVLEGILILGWAFTESLYDVKSLLAGKRIPLMKAKDTWHYDLKLALSPGNISESDAGKGLYYVDYLRLLLMLEQEQTIINRAMNMVEADIRQTPGNEDFRLDGCLDAIEVNVNIDSAYGYDCQFIRRKGYSTQ